ncbi:MAG: hypothetical protein J6V45_06110 [Kiritimatiellae bacterium]|nr:hypothetical protein [Kiritimatiellia bacterium]
MEALFRFRFRYRRRWCRSKDAVYDALKEIVGSEDRSKPFSDDKISELLKARGYSVARRTVAKYRAVLGIPGASERAG